MGACDQIERFPFCSEKCRLTSMKQAYSRLLGKKFGKHRMGVPFGGDDIMPAIKHSYNYLYFVGQQCFS